ncbi:hypothetical protein JCM19301_1181 [Jejuia pallidilutea]|uniref:Uncharacterized protein n=1 Tax=Jejuia pallidilutea TaxID=504487 RepID=A0A090VXV4_9FLAO|nr:hypothetical protein JCM19301_1181 [Jejuia pallidilutea]
MFFILIKKNDKMYGNTLCFRRNIWIEFFNLKQRERLI